MIWLPVIESLAVIVALLFCILSLGFIGLLLWCRFDSLIRERGEGRRAVQIVRELGRVSQWCSEYQIIRDVEVYLNGPDYDVSAFLEQLRRKYLSFF